MGKSAGKKKDKIKPKIPLHQKDLAEIQRLTEYLRNPPLNEIFKELLVKKNSNLPLFLRRVLENECGMNAILENKEWHNAIFCETFIKQPTVLKDLLTDIFEYSPALFEKLSHNPFLSKAISLMISQETHLLEKIMKINVLPSAVSLCTADLDPTREIDGLFCKLQSFYNDGSKPDDPEKLLKDIILSLKDIYLPIQNALSNSHQPHGNGPLFETVLPQHTAKVILSKMGISPIKECKKNILFYEHSLSLLIETELNFISCLEKDFLNGCFFEGFYYDFLNHLIDLQDIMSGLNLSHEKAPTAKIYEFLLNILLPSLQEPIFVRIVRYYQYAPNPKTGYITSFSFQENDFEEFQKFSCVFEKYNTLARKFSANYEYLKGYDKRLHEQITDKVIFLFEKLNLYKTIYGYMQQAPTHVNDDEINIDLKKVINHIKHLFNLCNEVNTYEEEIDLLIGEINKAIDVALDPESFDQKVNISAPDESFEKEEPSEAYLISFESQASKAPKASKDSQSIAEWLEKISCSPYKVKYKDLVTFLEKLDVNIINGSGSRRKFALFDAKIHFHQPHGKKGKYLDAGFVKSLIPILSNLVEQQNSAILPIEDAPKNSKKKARI